MWVITKTKDKDAPHPKAPLDVDHNKHTAQNTPHPGAHLDVGHNERTTPKYDHDGRHSPVERKQLSADAMHHKHGDETRHGQGGR
jgi:hypothetical protein